MLIPLLEYFYHIISVSHMFTIPVNTFSESLTVDFEKIPMWVSFIKKAQLILWRSPREDSNDVLTGGWSTDGDVKIITP